MASDDEVESLLLECMKPSGTVALANVARTPNLKPGPKRMAAPTKSSQQAIRRIDQRVLACKTEKKKALQLVRQDRQELLAATDGILRTRGDQGQVTYRTALRIAAAPSHLGVATLQEVMFGNGTGYGTILRSRLRVAECLRVLQRARLGVNSDQWVASAASSTSANDAQGLGPPTAMPSAAPYELNNDMALVPCAVEHQPSAVVGLSWKWDGKTISANLRERLQLEDQGAAVEGLEVWTGGTGVECFVQRGSMVRCLPTGAAYRTLNPRRTKLPQTIDPQSYIQNVQIPTNRSTLIPSRCIYKFVLLG